MRFQNALTGAIAALVVPASVAMAAQAGAPGTQTSNVPVYHLMQLEVKTAKVALEDFTAKTQAIRDCSDVRAVAKELKAKTKRNRFVRATTLPYELRDALEELPVGHATQPFSSDPAVARVIVLCNRA